MPLYVVPAPQLIVSLPAGEVVQAVPVIVASGPVADAAGRLVDPLPVIVTGGVPPPVVTGWAPGTATVSGVGLSGALVSVRLDGVAVGSATADGSGSWTLRMPAPPGTGSHFLTAVQTAPATSVSSIALAIAAAGAPRTADATTLSADSTAATADAAP